MKSYQRNKDKLGKQQGSEMAEFNSPQREAQARQINNAAASMPEPFNSRTSVDITTLGFKVLKLEVTGESP